MVQQLEQLVELAELFAELLAKLLAELLVKLTAGGLGYYLKGLDIN